MKPFISSLIVFIFVLISYTNGITQTKKKSNMVLELKLSVINQTQVMDKSAEKKKGRLIFEAKLINKTNQSVCVESIINNATLNFVVKDKNNKDIQKRYNIVEPQINADYYKIIKPYGEYKVNINLLESKEYRFKTDNVYYIYAVYSSENPNYLLKNKAKVFVGNLRSNTLQIKI